MENALNKVNYIEINGKQYEVPERFTFSQMLRCEKLGLKMNNIGSDMMLAAVVITSVITGISVDDLSKTFEYYFDEHDFGEYLEIILNPYTNFFSKNTK